MLYDSTQPGLDPFAPKNPLFFGVGPLGGTIDPCSGRFTVTPKSPLKGVFGDSNCGGHWGPGRGGPGPGSLGEARSPLPHFEPKLEIISYSGLSPQAPRYGPSVTR